MGQYGSLRVAALVACKTAAATASDRKERKSVVEVREVDWDL